MHWRKYTNLSAHSEIVHGTFSRMGGKSEGDFSSLNVSLNVGDHSEVVQENRTQIARLLDIACVVFPNQVHGANIARITRENCFNTLEADALFTTEKNLGLAIAHADCQAALFYDPLHELIAVAHAGWRGSVQNIYAKLIERLVQEKGTNPEELIVAISPSLGPCHAEFKNYRAEIPEEFYFAREKEHHFDFWQISRKQLLTCGVREKNIEIASVCTYCNEDLYYSYRRVQRTGRNATVIALQK